jgi:non-specific serine/threonine protein kinase
MGEPEPEPQQPQGAEQPTFGALLRRYRLAAGLSQERLAERAGISAQALSALENGRRHAPYRHTVTLLAGAMGLSEAETAVLAAAVVRGRVPASAMIPAPGARERESTPDGMTGTDGAMPVPAPQPQRTNLPVQLSSFIGREREQGEVRALLDAARLVTLTGAGGAGKTRLALAVACALLGGYPDGVWLVELAPVADPVHVARTVASTLDVAEQPGRPIRDSLIDALRLKHLLLLLDNCEHLVQACAELVETLLRACPELRVLATSRQALHVAGETTWRVPAMAVPPTESVPSDELLIRFDATRLFVERARGGFPRFAVSDQNGPAIVRICSRLDGIPLALELAAARVSVLGLDQIDARLHDRFRLLTAGSRTALPRQQTLRATLDWSFGLLSPHERVVFRRLAVFAGGWTLEAAEDICAGEGIGGDEVLELLAGLVDKSLVVADEAGESRRYRLLETMREYGWEKLRATGEEAAVRDRHRNWLLALAEEADRGLRGATQAAWLTRLEREHDNFRAALAWCTGEHRDPETGLRLAGALAWFWRLHGHIGEGRRWLTLALAPGDEASPARCRALNGAGLLAYAQGDYAAATALFEESLRLAHVLGDASAVAWSLHGLGRVAEGTHDFAGASIVLEESLLYFHACQDTAGSAYSRLYLANVARERADYARAAALYRETLVVAREVGDTWFLGWTLAYTAILAFLQGDVQRAAALFREGLVLLDTIRATWGIAVCLLGLAGVARAQGQPERAARLFGAERALRARLGTSTVYGFDHVAHRRSITAARAALGEQRFGALAAEGQAMALDEVVAYALTTDTGSPQPGHGAEQRSESLVRALLTPREQEVAALIARGFTNRQIADALVITPRTADTHVRNISTKLELHSRAQVAAWATEQGLLAATEPR